MGTISKQIIALIILFVSINSFSQEIQYIQAPENLQLYARNNSNSATVTIQGKFKKGVHYDNITLKVFKDNQEFDSQNCPIQNKQFNIDSKIDAGLHQFRFELLLKKGSEEKLVVLADSVVCGDAFIITGQSNSHASSTKSNYSNTYCRSFGIKTGYETYNDDDKKVRWGLATGNCEGLTRGGGWFMKNKFGVGVWGMELMRLIVEQYQIPVCIINGGSGSSSIEENMKGTPEQASLETSFGRLAYRVNQAGLKDEVKAIIWHQGETNSNYQQNESKPEDNYRKYSENFDILYNDWKSVYTALEKLYMFQLHPGCGGNYQSEMREIQCQIAEKYGADIMSTNGVVGHDGCHFSYEGYDEFAQRMFPLIGRDFYDENANDIITAPKLKKAFYSKANEITLQFDQPITMDNQLEVKGKIHFIKDQFFFDDDKIAGEIKAANVDNDKVILELNGSRLFRQITYLPNKCYLNTKDVYEGPWVSGTNGLGSLSFDRRTIEAPKGIKSQAQWNGYQLLDSTLNGVNFKIVFPKTANEKKDWIWRARFWGHQPQTDLALLEKGFHLVYIEVGGLFGSPKATKIWNEFYSFVQKNYQLNPKVVLEGMSRGGLIIFNWANQNANKVACIYGDAPVCDFKSWPGGKGSGPGSSKEWKACIEAYGFSEEVAMEYSGNPIDRMENIAKAKIPILNMVGDIDNVVPVAENTALLQKGLIELGWDLKVFHKPTAGHHPHSMKDPKPIVDFILMNTGNKAKKIDDTPEWSINNIAARSDFRNCEIQFIKNKMAHVAFLGGSITEMNGYRPMLCEYLENKFTTTQFNFTNAGIASTGSTTGAFRMERDVLSKGPLDMLFVEFAVNDDQDEIHNFENALKGMEGIIRKARKHNPNVEIVMTFFVNPNILADYQQGKIRTSITAHKEVAKQYNISTCNLAKEIADQITIGTLDWLTFGGTHPKPFGNRICANMIINMLEKTWSDKTIYKNPKAINSLNYEKGKLVSPGTCDFDKKWSYGIPDWDKLDGTKRERFLDTEMLCTSKTNAELALDFNGTAIGAYLLAGPDAGTVEVSIDNGKFHEFDLYHPRFSKGLHYPCTIMFSNILEKGNHTLKLRMLKTKSGTGNAARIMNFVVN